MSEMSKMSEFVMISTIGIELLGTEIKDGMYYDTVLANDVSDGYHTMSELYQHRHALFAALVKLYDDYKTPLGSHIVCWKSKLHADGTMHDGWFIVGMTVNKMDTTVEYISYHLPMDWWDKFNCMQYETVPPYDGYTSDDVIERLLRL